MKITRNQEIHSAPGPEAYFTGSVRVEMQFSQQPRTKAAAAMVTFEAGARTAWHTHPAGQTLIITSGMGWIQKEGEAIVEVFPGDVIYFEPEEKHWHGASPQKAMSHLAIQEEVDDKVVDWLEKVTDDQYKK
ncbi:(R)-mandelonitrile lyase [Leeuwenhoekiella palythoae]|uniref:Cupin domain protein n=1 Tax=Leeuwenhoekiella palythoae TaxID=573501 RepID=A0A1M5XGM1_9FLAO|nr:cupin domain-containing protein [Leeuwenhoekiella palythoae]RXG30017.1 transcriptional regulator [Leeuwenhoekiella palythoae]SHH98654.1 Cupin domain protein [Leeuwenhoekiella palythoae]